MAMAMALQFLVNHKLEFAQNIVEARNLQIYEYYDHISFQCDGKIFYIKDDNLDIMLEHYRFVESFISDYLQYLNNLELLSYTSRFPSESSYNFFKSLPPTLKTLHIDHTNGLNMNILPNNLFLFVNMSSDTQDQSVNNMDEYDYYEDFVKQIDINTNTVSKIIDDCEFLQNYLTFK